MNENDAPSRTIDQLLSNESIDIKKAVSELLQNIGDLQPTTLHSFQLKPNSTAKFDVAFSNLKKVSTSFA
jgi:transcriptional accessory protein Tex/SPT6